MTLDDLHGLFPSEEEILSRVHLDSNEEKPVARLEEMQLLCALARYVPADVAVETGSFTGSFAQALRLACPTVYSIDNYSHPIIRAKGPGIFIKSKEVWNSIHFIHGDGDEKLRTLSLPKSGWVFFHDSDHTYPHVLKELRTASELGASALACHDIQHSADLGTLAAWEQFMGEQDLWQHIEVGNIGLAVRIDRA